MFNTHGVSVIQINVKSERSSGEYFGRYKRISDRSFVIRFNDLVISYSGKVLYVEIEIHWITERSVDGIESKIDVTFVGKTDEKFD